MRGGVGDKKTKNKTKTMTMKLSSHGHEHGGLTHARAHKKRALLGTGREVGRGASWAQPPAAAAEVRGRANCIKIEGEVSSPDTAGTSEHLPCLSYRCAGQINPLPKKQKHPERLVGCCAQFEAVVQDSLHAVRRLEAGGATARKCSKIVEEK